MEGSKLRVSGVLLVVILAHGGCTENSAGDGQAGGTGAKRSAGGGAQDAATIDYDDLMLRRSLLPAPGAPGALGEDWSLVAGEPDVENRYPATVKVLARALGPEGAGPPCSGVLVAPRAVLTAGNCVCRRRAGSAPGGEAQTLIDSTACAKVATITTVAYDPPDPRPGMGLRARRYDGEVRPHPAMRIVLDGQGNVVSSEADLAMIVLEAPVMGDFPPLALAQAEAVGGETLVMVAFGHDGVRGSLNGDRRFRQHAVTRLAGTGGRVLYEQPMRHLYKGDSGGPCLRVTRTGSALVGILSRSLGQEPSFTSTFAYRAWLQEELQRVATGAAVSP